MSEEKILKFLKREYPLDADNIKSTKEILLDANIINQMTNQVKEYLEKFEDLEILSMSICHIKSLKNLPDLPNLKKLELNDNFITGDELSNLCKYKNLTHLKIANNKIKTLEEIKNLKDLQNFLISDEKLQQLNESKGKDNSKVYKKSGSFGFVI